jgi:amino acid transporter
MSVIQEEPKKRSLGNILFGRPLATQALEHQTVSKPVGLAVFASDAISSTAYATQEILFILALAGTSAAIFGLSIPIAIAISILLVIVTISYRQTIFAYPNGGGAYIVARDNLGEIVAQVAAAALLTDYILTVAVSISSGVAQITSAFPNLYPFRVEIALLVILLITIVNLRGVRESGLVFAIPTYFFLATMLLTLGVGLFQYFTGTLDTITDVEASIHGVVQPVTLFLLLRAFSSGCTALTGIEAISNGITAFREPRSRNAAITLTAMSSILIVLFLGITFLAHQIEAMPSETETIISQLGRAIFGDGSLLYLAVVAGTALILLMAANTSYADFPRLAALSAGDGFLPRQLTYRGGRLVFSWGIVALAAFASLLVIVMQASVTALIPLYAIGVFLSFTISQTGMVIRARRIGKMKPGEKVMGLETEMEYDPAWRLHMLISAVGAVATFVVMVIFAVTKFTSGAWFVLVLIPTLVFLFFRVHNHYKSVAKALRLTETQYDISSHPVKTVILVDGVHIGTIQLVNFAKSLKHPWQAVHIGINPQRTAKVREMWDSVIGEGELVIVPSPYRRLNEPIRNYVISLLKENPDSFVHVIVGHLAMENVFEQALHQNSVFIFNIALFGLERVVVTIVPLQIHHGGREDVNKNVFTKADLQGNVPPPADPKEAARARKKRTKSAAAPVQTETPPATGNGKDQGPAG